MSYNTKNYIEDGEKLVIGGTLELKSGAVLIGFPKCENQSDSTATTVADLKNDFNALLAKLKTSSLMGSDE